MIPEGYSTFEYYFISFALQALLICGHLFLLYIYYGIPLTMTFVAYRVFRNSRSDSDVKIFDEA